LFFNRTGLFVASFTSTQIPTTRDKTYNKPVTAPIIEFLVMLRWVDGLPFTVTA
jgi:hypothetical protein